MPREIAVDFGYDRTLQRGGWGGGQNVFRLAVPGLGPAKVRRDHDNRS